MKNVKDFQIVLSAIVIFAFLAMPLLLNAQNGKANFSGKWAINAEKSNFGQGQGQSPQRQGQGQGQRMGGFGGGNFVVKQEANLLAIERTRTNQNGEKIKTETKYTLDGNECVNKSGRGESKSTATWSADGKTLKIVTNIITTVNGESRKMKSTEEWSLIDANTLSVKTTRSTQKGDRVTIAVYDKK